MSQVEKRPGLIESNSIGVVGLFWWCFQLFLFDHRGFFSRIKCYDVTLLAFDLSNERDLPSAQEIEFRLDRVSPYHKD